MMMIQITKDYNNYIEYESRGDEDKKYQLKNIFL